MQLLRLALWLVLTVILAVQLGGSGGSQHQPTSSWPHGALAAPAEQLGVPIPHENPNVECPVASAILGIGPPLLAVAAQTNVDQGPPG
jgi:hypothetical protein